MKKSTTAILLSLLSLIVAAGFLFLYYGLSADATGPEQPIPFSHNVHVGIKQIQCQYCHPYVAYSNFPGIPPVEKCLHCHQYIISNHPWIREEHRYFNTESPTPWVKVNYIPEHVLFSHQRHINKNVACRECHGPVEDQHRLPAKDWRMGMCLECHQQRGANLDCWLACHS